MGNIFDLLGLSRDNSVSSKKNTSKDTIVVPTVSLDEARKKYLDVFSSFKICYTDYWKGYSQKRDNIKMIQSGLEFFTHSPDYMSIYAEKYKPTLAFVLDYNRFVDVFDSLNVMDENLNKLDSIALAKFGKARTRILSMIENEEKIGRAMTHIIISDVIFKQTIDTRLTKDTAALFALFSALTIAEKEYFNILCDARNKLA